MLTVNAASGFGSGIAGYAVPFSADFEAGDNDNMRWTPGGAASSNKIATMSMWIKNETTTGVQSLADAGSGYLNYHFNTSSPKLEVQLNGVIVFVTSAAYTDTSDWHHFLLRIDTTQSTASDRVRPYFDGTVITSLDTDAQPSINTTFTQYLVSGNAQTIGNNGGSSQAFDGLMAEMAVTDGQSYGPESFRDASTGSPLDLSGLTFGNNGWWLDNTTLGTDISGNGNNFTNTGTVQSSDVPT